MTKKISARQVRSMMNKSDLTNIASASSPTGACVATRFRPGTIDICRVMSKSACEIVRRELEDTDEGTANFFEGRNCSGI